MPVKTAPAPVAPVEIGDFFVSSWGYDQTNVDFYKVVGITPSGKSVKVQKWTNAVERDNGPQVYVVPGDSPATERVIKDGISREEYYAMEFWDAQAAQEDRPVGVETKRIQSYGSGDSQRVYFSVNSYSSASKWDGQPEYQTGSGYGH